MSGEQVKKGWKGLGKHKRVYKSDGFGLSEGLVPKSPLKRDFGAIPVSVWSARDADWQNRKRMWTRLGIQSELGRDVKVFASSNPVIRELGEKSIFDPVVCELVYNWFCPPGGQVVDPFAGGSVRGIVASVLGLRYWGCDLNEKQVEANRKQLNSTTTGDYPPTWLYGDCLELLPQAPECDLCFSCPPYSFLEVYTDDPRDMSNMSYEDFLKAYRRAIRLGCDKLKDGGFACFVVGNFRDKRTGALNDLVGDTVQAFQKAGLAYHNDVILLTQMSSTSFRCRRIFKGARRLARCHQNVLIFAKGKPPRYEDCDVNQD